ncbi:MAG: BNR-4 repeat-containing protein [Legionella sp.]|nr:BNR-4 repeat-containing protein [Legionella sp.]
MIKLKSLNKLTQFFLFSFCLLTSAFAFADGTIITSTPETKPFTVANGFTSGEPWSPVWHFKNSTYVVWVDANYRAWVTQVTDGKSTIVPLDTQSDYTVQPDGHHRFSLGVDSEGYIHITGDMHNYSDLTDQVINPYPKRYQKQIILYWKSNQPEDVSSGFSFAGGDVSTAIPGGGWTVGRFFADNKGLLYYSSMVHAFEALNMLGGQAVGLYRYDVETKKWQAIGDVVPYTTPYISHIKPVFYWELSGFQHSFFQNYQPSFKFDKNNVLHFAATVNTNPDLSNSNRLIYAESPDGGNTWRHINGTAMTGLPLRGIDGLPNSVDVVAEDKNGSGFGASVGTITDTNNYTGISISNLWYVWDGKAWTNNTTQNIPKNLPISTMGYRLPDNKLLFNSPNGTKILFSDNLTTRIQGYDFTDYKSFTNIDDYSLQRTGTLYGLAVLKDNSQIVLKTTIESAPLPDGWTGQDIDTVTTGFGGNSGYKNGHFIMTSYGQGMDEVNDSFHYTYSKMSGDGTISAHVTMPRGYSHSGVMMRETLDPNSKFAAALLNPRPDGVNSMLVWRAQPASNSIGASVATSESSVWLRLNRTGDVFTGYVSSDGTTWTKTYSTTVSMANEIYVGLASASYANAYYSVRTDFDNVVSPQPACVRANPTVTLSPSQVSGPAGGSVSLAVKVTNNDSAGCSNSTFNLTSTLPINITGGLSFSTPSLAPEATINAILKATSDQTLASGNYTLAVNATNASATSYTTQASAIYAVTEAQSCVLKSPTMQISPISQTTQGTNPVTYTLSVLSNDTATCPARLLQFSASTSPYGIKMFMEPYNVFVSPGKTIKSAITATPLANLPKQPYSLMVTDVSGAKASSTLILK